MQPERKTTPATLITGASAGLGRAMATQAARRGGTLVLLARGAEGLAQTEAAVREAGGRALCLPLDLTAPEAGDAVEAFLAEHGLHCHVLVNNAGFGLMGRAAEAPRERLVALVDLNVRSLVDLTLRLLPGMLARGGGGVIMLGSISGFAPGPGMAAYYASKAFVSSFSKALWQETRGSGVVVTCVAPGPVRTAFFATAQAREARLFKLLPKVSPEGVAAAAWSGFDAGRRMVVPGLGAKLTVLAMKLTPERLILPIVARLQRT